MENRACLVLENGMTFAGKAFGAAEDVTGEVVFTTAMTGYLERRIRPGRAEPEQFMEHRSLLIPGFNRQRLIGFDQIIVNDRILN